MMKKKILIVEDDTDISSFIKTILVSKYEVMQAFSGTEAGLLLKTKEIDLILLDLMLPGKNGFELLQEIKKEFKLDAPIIVLTAISDKETIAQLLLAGADDYLTKPFDPDELLARIVVQFRKKSSDMQDEQSLRVGKLVLDTVGFGCRLNGKAISLSMKEYQILKILMEHPNRIFTKEALYRRAWEEEFHNSVNTVNVHISRLRTKLKEADENSDYLETIWGVGVRIKDEKR